MYFSSYRAINLVRPTGQEPRPISAMKDGMCSSSSWIWHGGRLEKHSTRRNTHWTYSTCTCICRLLEMCTDLPLTGVPRANGPDLSASIASAFAWGSRRYCMREVQVLLRYMYCTTGATTLCRFILRQPQSHRRRMRPTCGDPNIDCSTCYGARSDRNMPPLHPFPAKPWESVDCTSKIGGFLFIDFFHLHEESTFLLPDTMQVLSVFC